MLKTKRFILIEDHEELKADERACWYWDTERPLRGSDPYVAKQCYKDRDPNKFVRYEMMALLFTDQCEYFAVCQNCRSTYSHLQWSGHTKNPSWLQHSAEYLQKHQQEKGWCEFCDPAFGSGGWRLDDW